MTEPTCVRCGRPTLDGYVCSPCASQSAHKLAEIAEVAPASRDVANGLSRRNGTGASGKPGSRLPLDLTAMAKLDAVENSLTGWARHIAEERGLHLDTFRPVGDQVPWLARWLVSGVEWYRHRPEADEFLTDVDACLRIVRSIARGPAAQRYLGPCGAVSDDCDHGPECPGSGPDCARANDEPCDGDVYAREGASEGACRVCGAKWFTAERSAWLDGEARSHAYTATEIADAYPIKANTIRQWLTRGLLVAHGELNGRPLLLLGDVLDLAAGDAARREEARATRARRKEQAA